MRESVTITRTIDAPSERAWSAVAAIDGIDRWLPLIASSQVEGTGVGARRVLQIADGGGEIEDRIDAIDPQNRLLRYTRLRSPFPVSLYVGTVIISTKPDNRCEMSWTVEIDVEPESRDGMVTFLKSALTTLVDGFGRDLEQNAAVQAGRD